MVQLLNDGSSEAITFWIAFTAVALLVFLIALFVIIGKRLK